MKNEICQAINNKRLLGFYYDSLYRKVEPYTYGINTANNEALCAYQIDGQSKKRQIPSWGFFLLDKIENLNLLNDTFNYTQVDYRRGDKRMHQIFAEI